MIQNPFGKILLISLIGNLAFADCDYSKIQKVDGGFLYSREIHLCVGEMKQDLEIATQKLDKLNKAIELKDLTISKADERTTMWRNESYEQFERLQKQNNLLRQNETLYFILGVVVMGASVWASGQLR